MAQIEPASRLRTRIPLISMNIIVHNYYNTTIIACTSVENQLEVPGALGILSILRQTPTAGELIAGYISIIVHMYVCRPLPNISLIILSTITI